MKKKKRISPGKTLRITQFGNPILRRKQKSVSESMLHAGTFRALVKKMFPTMHRANGVGLAAPQVGKNMSFAVVEVRKTRLRPDTTPLAKTVIINPRITSHSRKVEYDWEGCLSLESVRGLVPRYKEIAVEYEDLSGKKIVRNLKGYHARVFQHEIDHLNGILYVDRMDDMRTLTTLKELEKEMRNNR